MAELNAVKIGNDQSDDDEEKMNECDLLEVGHLPHHEIKSFTMDEDKIEAMCKPVSWSNCDGTTFDVRCGPNYTSGQKAASKKALYNVFAMDAYKLANKMNKIFEFININKYIDKYKLAHEYDAVKYPLPPLLIINFMIPNYCPEIRGGKTDGDGYQIIVYAHLTKEIQNELINGEQRASVKLFADFIHSDLVKSELRNRFKVIARIMNTKHTDFGFLANRLVKRYNGTPFLARTSSTFYHKPGAYFAADIDVHLFGYPARKGLSYVKGTAQSAIYDIGFVIQGQSNDELPEQILACCRLSKMGVDQAKPFPIKFQKIYDERHTI